MQEGNENECTVGLSECILVVFCIISLTQGTVGYMYRNDCPGAPYIPIYMMVMGASVMFSLMGVSLLLSCNRDHSSMCIYFLFISYIAGNVIIFSIHNENISGKLNCDKTLDSFAYWTTISTISIIWVDLLLSVLLI